MRALAHFAVDVYILSVPVGYTLTAYALDRYSFCCGVPDEVVCVLAHTYPS